MAFVNNRLLCGIAAAVCTAVLIYFGTGLHPWWPLMWFAPLPVLWLAVSAPPSGTAAAAFAAMFLSGLNQWTYYNRFLHLPIGVQAAIYTVPALFFMFSVLLTRALLRRQAWWAAVIAFPAAWTTFEYIGNRLSPHGTAGSISYSQLGFLPFLQIASLTGPWGITFFLLLFSSALVAAFAARRSHAFRSLSILAPSWGLIAIVLIYGAIRVSRPESHQRVKVGLIASDAPGNTGVVSRGPKTQRLLQEYASRAEELAAQGAQVIVIPEKLGVLLESDAQSTNSLFQSLADRTNATMVIGVVDIDGPVSYNQARVYRPGAPRLTYNKHHMLPPFESEFKIGDSITVMPEPTGLWGVAICKDMDFTPLSRQYGNAGAGLMLIPAWDFNIDRLQHGHMAIMRAVESGFSIARAAKQGYLTVTDNRGRILAEKQSNAAPFATLLADAPTTHAITWYLILGDWFAWFAIAALLLAFGRIILASRTMLAQRAARQLQAAD